MTDMTDKTSTAEREAADCFNTWFMSLPERRQDVFRKDMWLFAYAAYQAGRASLPLPGAQEPVAPHGWLYDWTHSSATGRPDETYTGFTKDEQHARKHDNCTPVYTAPHPALSAGWVMVPIEPTEAMVSAGYDAFGVHDCYAAMIAAAPTLPVEPSKDGESNADQA